MKKLLQVGGQLDINAAYDGGAVDSSVQYSVPVSMQDVITVDSAGVVSAVSEGTAIVEIKDTSGNLLRSVVIEVLSETDYGIQVSLDSALLGGPGTDFVTSFVTLSGGNDNGSATGSLTLASGGTVVASSVDGYQDFGGVPLTQVFAGVQGTQWETISIYQDIVNEWVGKQFAQPKTIKKVRARFVTAPNALNFEISSDMVNWTSIDQQAVGDYYTGSLPATPNYYTLNENHIWLEFDMPSYGGAIGFRVRPATSSWPSGVPTDGGPNVDRWRIAGLEFYE